MGCGSVSERSQSAEAGRMVQGDEGRGVFVGFGIGRSLVGLGLGRQQAVSRVVPVRGCGKQSLERQCGKLYRKLLWREGGQW